MNGTDYSININRGGFLKLDWVTQEEKPVIYWHDT